MLMVFINNGFGFHSLCCRPYYYQGGQSDDDSSMDGYDYRDYDSTKAYFPDYYTGESAAPLPLDDYQQALIRQNFIDFLIKQGPNLYKDHKKMKYMYRATNTYPRPLEDSYINMFYQSR